MFHTTLLASHSNYRLQLLILFFGPLMMLLEYSTILDHNNTILSYHCKSILTPLKDHDF